MFYPALLASMARPEPLFCFLWLTPARPKLLFCGLGVLLWFDPALLRVAPWTRPNSILKGQLPENARVGCAAGGRDQCEKGDLCKAKRHLLANSKLTRLAKLTACLKHRAFRLMRPHHTA